MFEYPPKRWCVMADFADASVSAALETALSAATHLDEEHAATVAAARALAAKIDAWQTIVEWALDDASGSSGRPAVPANDNTSLPTFLKFMESLRLVPQSPPKASASPVPTAEAAPADDPAGKIVSMQRKAASRKAR